MSGSGGLTTAAPTRVVAGGGRSQLHRFLYPTLSGISGAQSVLVRVRGSSLLPHGSHDVARECSSRSRYRFSLITQLRVRELPCGGPVH